MVMRNRGEGSDAPHWWDDLPPQIRGRFTAPIAPPAGEDPAPQPRELPSPVSGTELVGAIAHLVLALALVIFGLTLFLIAAIQFVHT